MLHVCLTIRCIPFLLLHLFHRYAEYEIVFTLLRSDSAGKIAIIRLLDLDSTWHKLWLDLTWLSQEKMTWDLFETWGLRLESYLRLAHMWLGPISAIEQCMSDEKSIMLNLYTKPTCISLIGRTTTQSEVWHLWLSSTQTNKLTQAAVTKNTYSKA